MLRIAKDERWCCIQHVEEEQNLEISTRGERPREAIVCAGLGKLLLAFFEPSRGCLLSIERAALSMNDLAGALDKELSLVSS
ncbi:MAG: hypothetical protein DMG68_03720 [Acidobacteria bacterium]|nr:MAG: hypothetical protein DMG68_03720 [Acidobacteriota bacterium]TMJ49945.1 MAG: hypothetical protein E6G85_19790 [Alphaproteobacteria bacterium]